MKMIQILCAGLFLAATARPAANSQAPHIGYLYPAGGQRASTVEVYVGGQFLRGAVDVYVSGKGVRGTVVRQIPNIQNLNGDQRKEVQRQMRLAWQTQLAKIPNRPGFARFIEERKKAQQATEPTTPVELPEHPMLNDLENKSLAELAHITTVLFGSRAKQQQNRQLAETVLVELTIAPDAEPGVREIRLHTAAGLTNPMRFEVGLQPEAMEIEPNGGESFGDFPNMPRLTEISDLLESKPLTVPTVVNGQILPGDVDRFRFRAQRGQQLVITVAARSLIPYLADAVPGWFQATLALYDADGKEIAYTDDYQFDPDPAMMAVIPKNGEYQIEIRDSIYRGREDFVYRLTIGQQPFITSAFPLGAAEGKQTAAAIEGWNLKTNQLPLNSDSGAPPIRQTRLCDETAASNVISYAVDTLPECSETADNDTPAAAQLLRLPMIVNGRIDSAGDVDVFAVEGRKDQMLVVEVMARQLRSPLDSRIRLTDRTGKLIAENDDFVSKDSFLYKDAVGTITHPADSYLMTPLPADGKYFVHLSDARQHGGTAYGYRLRVSPPQPDFELRITPSSLYVRTGNCVPVCAYVLAKDGFNSPIDMSLVDSKWGFELEGGHIPAGCNRLWMTVKAPADSPGQPVNLQFKGTAVVNGKTVVRAAIPADDMMQAFLYRHLVPSQELFCVVQKSRGMMPSMKLSSETPLRIPAGGKSEVFYKTPRKPAGFAATDMVLSEPPKGITLENPQVVQNGIKFDILADPQTAAVGSRDNLIVELIFENAVKDKTGKSTGQTQRTTVGVLPAIPIEITAGQKSAG